MNQFKNTIITVFLTAVIVLSAVYVGYRLGQKDKSITSMDLPNTQEEVVKIPVEKKIEKPLGQKDKPVTSMDLPNTQEEVVKIPVEKKIEKPQLAAVNCTDFGSNWTLFEATSNFSFCYRNEWGAPKVEQMNVGNSKGELYNIEFANTRFGTSGPNFPVIWYETENYQVLGDSDFAQTCFSCINFNDSPLEIANAMGLPEPSNYKKIDISGKPAFASADKFSFAGDPIESFTYYLPKAFNNYDLQVTIGKKYAAELDAFVKTIRLK